jgi:CheY-like chemotaxis protein
MLDWSKLLNLHDIQIDIPYNGKEVFEMVLKNDCDLILIDIQMSIMDGIECTGRIRSDLPKGKRRVPIIAANSNALKADNNLYINLGMDDYLSKQLAANLFFSKIKRLDDTYNLA